MSKVRAQNMHELQIARFHHQQMEYDRFKFAPARAYGWQMRTGKTRMAIESAFALEASFEINGVLVIAPNGVHRQWAEDQIPKWYPLHCDAFTWISDYDVQLCKDWILSILPRCNHLYWFCVNMEALLLERCQKAINAFKRVVGEAMLIVDESHHFGHPNAKRTGILRGFGRKFEFKRILSGTLAEDSPFNTYSQYELLERAALGHTTFSGTAPGKKSLYPCPTCGERCRGFKNEFGVFELVQGGGHPRIECTDYKNLDVLKTRMAKYTSVVLRSDCEDLPDLQFDTRLVEMTKEQKRWWNAVKDQALDELDILGQTKVFAGGALYTKLQQIEGGFILNETIVDNKKVKIAKDICGKNNPKMLILADEIVQYDGQVVIWFEYIHEIDASAKFLSALGIKAGVFHGRALRSRDRDLAAFKSGKLDVLLAQPQAGGEGRDFSVAGKIMWYSHTPVARIRNQANERATMMGGASIQLVDLIAPIGKYYLKITSGKSTIADDVTRNGLRATLEGMKV